MGEIAGKGKATEATPKRAASELTYGVSHSKAPRQRRIPSPEVKDGAQLPKTGK